jgi:hypothetical protein
VQPPTFCFFTERFRGTSVPLADFNHQLTVPAHPRHDLPAVMFVARHDRLVVTVSKREPSLFGPSGGFLVGGPE